MMRLRGLGRPRIIPHGGLSAARTGSVLFGRKRLPARLAAKAAAVTAIKPAHEFDHSAYRVFGPAMALVKDTPRNKPFVL